MPDFRRMVCKTGRMRMTVERVKPEYDDLARLASENDVSLDSVRKAIRE